MDPNSTPNLPTTLPTKPSKPSLGIGTANVTLAYADLQGLLSYVRELESYLAALEAEELRVQQASLAGDASASTSPSEAMADVLRAAVEVARFPVAYFHPGENLGSYIPSEALRSFARGLLRFFGPASPEASTAQAFIEYAQSADAYRQFRAAREVAWKSPCATCGCGRAEHAETNDPLVRGACLSGRVECLSYLPSAPLPSMPAL